MELQFPSVVWGVEWSSVVLNNRANNSIALPLAFLIAESGLSLSNSNSTDCITEAALANPVQVAMSFFYCFSEKLLLIKVKARHKPGRAAF